MSPQADYVVSNGTGAAVRSDINGQLAAIVSNNSGASAPATTYAYQFWADTSTNLLKLRNGANSAFITVGDLTAANLGLATLASPTFTGTATIPTLTVSTAANIPLGSAASPTLYFTGDSNTGLYSPGADQVALSTGGTGRLFIDSSGRCGIGTSAPVADLQVNKSSDVTIALSNSNSVTSGNRGQLAFYNSASSTVGQIRFGAVTDNVGTEIQFHTRPAAGSLTQSMTLDSSGRLGIGSNAPQGLLDLGAADSATALAVAGWRAASYNGSILQWGGITASQWSTAAFFTGGSERARLDSSGRWLLGTSSARENFFNSFNGAQLQLEGTNGPTSRLSIVRNSADNGEPTVVLAKSRGSSAGSNTAAQSGDFVGLISFQGSDGSEFVEAAQILAAVDGTPGTNDMPGRLVFSTTADGASSPTERMRIDSSGYVTIYKNSSNLARLNFEASSTRLEYNDATGHLSFYTNSSSRMYVAYGGPLLPTTDNSIALGGNSNRWTVVYAVNGTIQTSDLREKTEVTPSALGSDFIKQLRPVSYKWNVGENVVTKAEDGETDIVTPRPGERTHWGFIAQEVKEAVDNAGVDFGGWILTDKDDPNSTQGLRYDQFIAPLTKALQETMAELEALKAEVAALKAQ